MKKVILACVLFVTSLGGEYTHAQTTREYARQVNTLIGTKGVGLASGYLYPGATYPYGMVQFTPSYFSKRSGFVINQLSGAGCEHMGNFPTFPLKGKLKFSPKIYWTVASMSPMKRDMPVTMRLPYKRILRQS